MYTAHDGYNPVHQGSWDIVVQHYPFSPEIESFGNSLTFWCELLENDTTWAVVYMQTLALGQAILSPMLEGEGSIPVRDVAFSPLIYDTD